MTEPPKRTRPKGRALLFATMAWVALAALIIAGMAAYQHRRISADLDRQASVFHRVASQRADQHDAHLTALSAIATTDGARDRSVFIEVAETIRRFYPRIVEIDLIPRDPQLPITSTRSAVRRDTATLIRDAARRSSGELVVLASSGTEHSLLVKRSPNTDLWRFALALEIDAAALLASDDPFWSERATTRALALPDGTPLMPRDPVRRCAFPSRWAAYRNL